MIQIRINDSRVWNPMQHAANIMRALCAGHRVMIDLMNEAPCLAECELGDFLHWLRNNGFDLSSIQIHTGNLLENFPGVQIVHRADFMYELAQYQHISKSLKVHKNIQRHFGHFVGRCTMPRLLLSSYLFNKYPDKTLQTLHWRHGNDYHKTHLEFEKIIDEFGPLSEEASFAWNLLGQAPLLLDRVDHYPIIDPVNGLIGQHYHDFFVDIICETWYQGRTFFLTEKFWRAVANETPFILHSSQWALENLRSLGFKTFSDWWDEGYSQDPGYHRLVEIKRVIDTLAQCSIKDLNDMYQEMRPVLRHNRQRLESLTLEDLHNVA